MNEPTFTIIIPAYNREKTIERCLNSVINQTYDHKNYQIIVIDDGSTDGTLGIVERVLSRSDVSATILPLAENKGRLNARNRGMDAATKDWICWLDSDDEYLSTYLETIARAIARDPSFRIFNFGAVVYDETDFNFWVRDTFMPETSESGDGHVAFKSGRIGAGSFVFAKSLFQEFGHLPEARTPYGDDGSFPALATQRVPELRPLYGQNEDGQWKPFGNPWGDDYFYFFMMTRKYLSKPLNVPLYIQHLRK